MINYSAMDEILPVTLLDIIESVGKRNDCTGYKIYSSGCKTNIVIHFLDSNILNNDQSCETKINEQMQLKSSSYSKRRSPCNQLRDIQRVKDHSKNNLLQSIDCQPNLDSKSSEESLPGDVNLILSAEQDDSKQTQENDSGFPPILDSSESCNLHGEQSANATEESIMETHLDEDKNKDSSLEKEKDNSKSFDSKSNSNSKKSKSCNARGATNKKSFEQMQRNYDSYLARRYEHEHHYGPYHPHRYPPQFSTSHNSPWKYYYDT